MERMIVQAKSAHILPVVAKKASQVPGMSVDGLAITFARNKFNCWDSEDSIYANDEAALKKIKSYLEGVNNRVPNTYVFLTPEEYAQFGDNKVMTAIWEKIKSAALRHPETLSDVLSHTEIEILKRNKQGTVLGYIPPPIETPVVPNQMRPKAFRGARSTKAQELEE